MPFLAASEFCINCYLDHMKRMFCLWLLCTSHFMTVILQIFSKDLFLVVHKSKLERGCMRNWNNKCIFLLIVVIESLELYRTFCMSQIKIIIRWNHFLHFVLWCSLHFWHIHWANHVTSSIDWFIDQFIPWRPFYDHNSALMQDPFLCFFQHIGMSIRRGLPLSALCAWGHQGCVTDAWEPSPSPSCSQELSTPHIILWCSLSYHERSPLQQI